MARSYSTRPDVTRSSGSYDYEIVQPCFGSYNSCGHTVIRPRPLRPPASSASSAGHGVPCDDSAPLRLCFPAESQIKNSFARPLRPGTQEQAQCGSRFSFKVPFVIVTCGNMKSYPYLSFIMNFLGTFLRASQSRVVHPRFTARETGNYVLEAGILLMETGNYTTSAVLIAGGQHSTYFTSVT